MNSKQQYALKSHFALLEGFRYRMKIWLLTVQRAHYIKKIKAIFNPALFS